MNSKQRRVYDAIFANPIRSNVRWADIEALFRNQGAIIIEGSGSRMTVKLNGVEADFHRPHPGNETDRGALKSVRAFLDAAGVDPDS